jgi:hypothetical protein
MVEKPRQEPHLSERGKSENERRRERLAAALRDNLRKRKQQTRARKNEASTDETC